MTNQSFQPRASSVPLRHCNGIGLFRRQTGMTILEIMIVLAIIAGGFTLLRAGFRSLSKADLTDDAIEVTWVLRRAADLAMETSQMHRVVFDLDKHILFVEKCTGASEVARNDTVAIDEAAKQKAMERAQQRMRGLPADSLAGGDAEVAMKRATALAGHHVADRLCALAVDFSGDPQGKPLERKLKEGKGIKFRKIWVAHKEKEVDSGQVAVYFFPVGSAQKAIVEITDGSDTLSVFVYGLTGRVELRDSEAKDPEAHMLRNPRGDREKAREEAP